MKKVVIPPPAKPAITKVELRQPSTPLPTKPTRLTNHQADVTIDGVSMHPSKVTRYMRRHNNETGQAVRTVPK